MEVWGVPRHYSNFFVSKQHYTISNVLEIIVPILDTTMILLCGLYRYVFPWTINVEWYLPIEQHT